MPTAKDFASCRESTSGLQIRRRGTMSSFPAALAAVKNTDWW